MQMMSPSGLSQMHRDLLYSTIDNPMGPFPTKFKIKRCDILMAFKSVPLSNPRC